MSIREAAKKFSKSHNIIRKVLRTPYSNGASGKAHTSA
jgi:transposase